MYNELKDLLNEYYTNNYNNFHILVEDLNLENKEIIKTAILHAETEIKIYKLLLQLSYEESKELINKYYDTDYKEMRAQNE